MTPKRRRFMTEKWFGAKLHAQLLKQLLKISWFSENSLKYIFSIKHTYAKFHKEFKGILMSFWSICFVGSSCTPRISLCKVKNIKMFKAELCLAFNWFPHPQCRYGILRDIVGKLWMYSTLRMRLVFNWRDLSWMLWKTRFLPKWLDHNVNHYTCCKNNIMCKC